MRKKIRGKEGGGFWVAVEFGEKTERQRAERLVREEVRLFQEFRGF